MDKTKSLSELALLLNNSGDFSYSVNPWEKGGKQRLYLPKKFGYNTKKMSTSAYIAIVDDKAIACVFIDCPSQPDSWIKSQQKEFAEHLQPYVDFCNEHFEFGFTTESIEVIMNNATLDAQPVKGFYTEWRQVRVAINNFGKLATRNRQFCIAFEGTKNTAPRTFVALTDAGYDYFGGKEKMLDAYEEVPDFDARAIQFAEWKAGETQRQEERLQQAAQQLLEEARKKEELNAKMAIMVDDGANPLVAWKLAGCPHPAPAEVVEAKKASGLNWKQFSDSIKGETGNCPF